MNTTQLAIALGQIPAKSDGTSVIVFTTNHKFEGYLNLTDDTITSLLAINLYDDIRTVYIDVAEIIAIEGDAKEMELEPDDQVNI